MSADSSRPFFTCDLEQWPVVHFAIVRAPIDAAELGRFEMELVGVLNSAIDSAERVLLLLNVDGVLAASFPLMARAAEIIKSVRPLAGRAVHCTAIVISNVVVRNIFGLVTKLQPLQNLHCMFENETKALAWAQKNLALAKAGKPPEINP